MKKRFRHTCLLPLLIVGLVSGAICQTDRGSGDPASPSKNTGTGTASAGSSLTEVQGDAILSELRAIHQLLERQQVVRWAEPAEKVNMSVGEGWYSMGRDDAPLTLVEFAEYQFAARGINLHIDPTHDSIPECGPSGILVVTNQTSGPSGGWMINPACGGDASTGGVTSMHALKQIHLGPNALLSPAYHYLVFSHYSTCPDQAHCNACGSGSESPCGPGPLLLGSPGDAEVFGDDAIVSFGAETDHRETGEPAVGLETWTANTMHELGHNLGLLHGGAADCTNQKPNYLSVMNYDFGGGGLIQAAYPGATTYKTCQADADCVGEPYHCSEATDTSDPSQCGNPNDPTTCPHWCYHVDYSDTLFNVLDQEHLDETIGLQGAPDNLDLTFYYSNGGTKGAYGPVNGAPIDWNQDGTFSTDVCDDVSDNEPSAACGALPALQPSNDWLSHIEGTATVFDNFQLAYQCAYNFAYNAARVVRLSGQIPSPVRTGRNHDWLRERVLSAGEGKKSSLR